MYKAVFLMIGLVGFSACDEYQGRQTNCFTEPGLSFAARGPGNVCGDWVVISE